MKTMKRVVLLLFVAVLWIKCWAWQGAMLLPDTSKSFLDGISSTSQRIEHRFLIVKSYQYTFPEIAKRHAGDALVDALYNEDKKRAAIAEYWLSWLEFQNSPGPYEIVLSNVNKTLDNYTNQIDPLLLSKLLSLRAALQISMNNPKQAEAEIENGINKVPFIKNHPVDSMWVLGYLYSLKANTLNNDIDLQKKSLKLFETIGDSVRVGRTCVKIGNYYIRSKDYRLADIYLRRAINAQESVPYAEGRNEAFDKYIDLLLYEYDNPKDDSLFNKIKREILQFSALNAGKGAPLVKLGIAYAQKASLYSSQPSISDTLLRKAMDCFKEVLPLAVKEHDDVLLGLVADNMMKYCPFVNYSCDSSGAAIASAYREHILYKNQQASIAQNDLQNYHVQGRLAMHKAEVLTRNWIMGVSGAIIAGLIVVFVVYNQRRKIKTLNRELENRIAALRAQMNPHFISNALNAIDSLVNHSRNKEASHYIIQFSRLCRIILNNSRTETISLGEELDMLTYFLNLEKLRLGEKLSYVIEIDPNLNKDNIQIPPMLVQPFVENAIWHGILPLSEPNTGLVSVKAEKMDNQFFRCIIEDNGVGREKSKALKKQMVVAQPSHGLSITEERLEAIKKLKGSDIFMEDLFHADKSPAGTRVTIKLPLTV